MLIGSVVGILAIGAGWVELWPHTERTNAALHYSQGSIVSGTRFGATLRPIIIENVSRKSALMTDTASGYMAIGKEFARHEMVDHGKDEYVRGDAYSNTVEGYFAILKRGVYGTFHHISEAHLARYLAEFDFRYSNRQALGINDTMRTDELLREIGGKRLTYRRIGEGANA